MRARRWPWPLVQTLADGAAVAGPSELTFELIRRYVDEVVTVPEAEIEHAMVLLIERTNFVVEGAGALGIAALLSGAVEARRDPVAVVLSGGNVDINLLGRIVERGLTGAGRASPADVRRRPRARRARRASAPSSRGRAPT